MAYTPILGTSIRRQLEEREEEILSPHACLNKNSAGRMRVERDDESDIRMPFERDRDRITHSKTFRRLKHKTQVFLAPAGDHYRTRLTHVLEVSQIARTVASALCLNVPLTEAIALGHDLGHTPFGHAGEATLNELHPSGFRHYIHSLRVVDTLEHKGKGLNLTLEVRNGIVKHSKGRNAIFPENDSALPSTLEGQVVRVADIIAYVNHDMDDALRAGILKENDLPADIRAVVGERHSKRIGAMVRDLIVETLQAGDGRLHASKKMLGAITDLRTFLYENVYRYYRVHNEFEKAQRVIRDLYQYFMENGSGRFAGNRWEPDGAEVWSSEKEAHRQVCDFIAGMTDRYAMRIYDQIFLPKAWNSQI